MAARIYLSDGQAVAFQGTSEAVKRVLETAPTWVELERAAGGPMVVNPAHVVRIDDVPEGGRARTLS